MEARARKLEGIFDSTITYQIPLFQRPYIWEEEKHWVPLWEDIQVLLNRHLANEKNVPHFLGAVVLERLDNPTGSIQSRQVIDGQQRFTTIQLFLIAARDHAKTHGIEKYYERFNDLVSNKKNKIDHENEVYKVWPTNSNRAPYQLVHEAGSLEGVDEALKENSDINGSDNIINGYKFFYSQIGSWLSGNLDDDYESKIVGASIEDKFDALWYIAKEKLQLVVIDLDQDDETQVIFETLNARGEPLLPADLIKNYLFRRAAIWDSNENIEKLYEKYWKNFDQEWWREEVKQGRTMRPRIDLFINYYLAMMLCEDVKASQLFNTFKVFVESTSSEESGQVAVPSTPPEHLQQLANYSKVFKCFYERGKHERLDLFLDRLQALDTTTVFPFLLYTHAKLVPNNIQEFNKIIEIIESYLIRRMICGLTTKNYNRYFIDLMRNIRNNTEVTAKNVIAYISKSDADSVRFPGDAEFEREVLTRSIYKPRSQYKVRLILEALNMYAQTSKSELINLTDKLTIEHIMPQEWTENWPLNDSIQADPVLKYDATQYRNSLIDTIGNLTLITGSLNSAQSNAGWNAKRPELLKFSKLNLTQYFYSPEVSEVWDEDAIKKRTFYLFEQMKKIWPAI